MFNIVLKVYYVSIIDTNIYFFKFNILTYIDMYLSFFHS